MNSIAEALTPSSVVAGVLQTLRSPLSQDRILVVVEGIDDERLYSKCFDAKNTLLYNLGGCLNVQELLGVCKLYSSRFIVIKDADFDYLNGEVYTDVNLFLTDVHDAETMVLQHVDINDLCCEYLRKPVFNFLQDVFDNLRNLSYMKWYNDINNLRVNFDAVKIANIYNGEADISLSDCIGEVYGNKANDIKYHITADELEEFIKDKTNADYFMLSNGHDVCDCICLKLKHLGYGNITNKEVARCLRVLFTIDRFRETRLYCKLIHWCEHSGKNILN